MEIAVVVVLVVSLVVLIALVLVVLRRLSTPASHGPSSELAVSGPVMPVVRSDLSDEGALILRIDDRVLATLDLDPVSSSSQRALPAGAAATAAVLELARSVPELLSALRTAGPRLVFSSKTIRGLADGSLRMMTGDYAMAVEAATSRVVEVGKVGGVSATRLATSWPLLLSGGTAIAAAALQQQQLGSTLSEIDAGIDAIYQRHIDDDSGRLHAAADLAREVIDAAQEGAIPAQVAAELAIARRDVDAIYFARREQMRRFIHDVELAQNQHEERHGQAIAWAKGVRKAFGDPAHFHADALAFVRAAAVKAHLTAGTAAVVAGEGRPDYSFGLLERNEDLLRADVLDLHRRVRALAANPPEQFWNRFERDDAHAVVTSLMTELDQRITPLLPLETPETIILEFDPAVLQLQHLPVPLGRDGSRPS